MSKWFENDRKCYMWLGSHLPHFWNAVCGWTATYLISKMLHVAGQTLTSFLRTTSTPHSSPPQIHIYIYIYIYIIPKTLSPCENRLFPRKLFICFETMILFESIIFLRNCVTCFENMIDSFENIIVLTKLTICCRKYDLFFRVYDSSQES